MSVSKAIDINGLGPQAGAYAVINNERCNRVTREVVFQIEWYRDEETRRAIGEAWAALRAAQASLRAAQQELGAANSEAGKPSKTPEEREAKEDRQRAANRALVRAEEAVGEAHRPLQPCTMRPICVTPEMRLADHCVDKVLREDGSVDRKALYEALKELGEPLHDGQDC